MSTRDKAGDLASRIGALSKSLDRSDELLEEGEEVLEQAEEIKEVSEGSLKDIISRNSAGTLGVVPESATYADIMNLQVMTEDFKFVRDTLKEVTENAKRVQHAITLELLDSDGDKRSSLVMSFSELSKAITDAQKLYVQSYREMSNTLLNLDKIKKNSEAGNPSTTNNLHIHTEEKISTGDLISRLKNGED